VVWEGGGREAAPYPDSLILITSNIEAQTTSVDFDSNQWVSVNSQKQEFLGRKSLMGYASHVPFGSPLVSRRDIIAILSRLSSAEMLRSA
jgi:hypothetical protein